MRKEGVSAPDSSLLPHINGRVSGDTGASIEEGTASGVHAHQKKSRGHSGGKFEMMNSMHSTQPPSQLHNQNDYDQRVNLPFIRRSQKDVRKPTDSGTYDSDPDSFRHVAPVETFRRMKKRKAGRHWKHNDQ
jgi:hypothetical protein